MIKKLSALLGAMALALGLGLAVATPAQAIGACPVNNICFYDTGVSATYMENRDAEDYSPGVCISISSFANNKTSYITNRASHAWRVYNAGNCTGSPGVIYANSTGGMNAEYNNNISSYRNL